MHISIIIWSSGQLLCLQIHGTALHYGCPTSNRCKHISLNFAMTNGPIGIVLSWSIQCGECCDAIYSIISSLLVALPDEMCTIEFSKFHLMDIHLFKDSQVIHKRCPICLFEPANLNVLCPLQYHCCLSWCIQKHAQFRNFQNSSSRIATVDRPPLGTQFGNTAAWAYLMQLFS